MWCLPQGLWEAQAGRTATEPPGRYLPRDLGDWKSCPWKPALRCPYKIGQIYITLSFLEMFSHAQIRLHRICFKSSSIEWRKIGWSQSGLHFEIQGWYARDPVAHWVTPPWNLFDGRGVGVRGVSPSQKYSTFSITRYQLETWGRRTLCKQIQK